MTQMQLTSLWAYQDIRETLGANQARVLEVIERLGYATDKQIAKELGWDINCVTGRRNELKKKNLIKEWGNVIQNGRTVIAWRPI